MRDVVGIDEYATHQQALVKYLLVANKGDTIVELGCGYYSSLIISEICKALNLEYKIYYQEENWKQQVESFVEAEFIKVDFTNFKLDCKCHLVLLDQEQLIVDRYRHIDDLTKKTKYLVIHDENTYRKRGLNLVSEYPNGELFSKLTPSTYVIKCSQRLTQTFSTPKLTPKLTPKKLFHIGEKSNKYCVVCCYVPGGAYDDHYERYISELYRGVKNNITIDIDFYCVTPLNLSIKGVRVIKPKREWKGWFIKAEIFNQDVLDQYDSITYVDLDTIIVGNFNNFIKNDHRFMMTRGFYDKNLWDSELMKFNPSDFKGIYEDFINSKLPTDAEIIANFAKRNNINPVFSQDLYDVASYKVDILTKNRDVDDYSVICFHGVPKPHDVDFNPRNIIQRTGGMGINGGNPFIIKSVKKVNVIPQDLDGEDVFIIGGGPSIKNIDLNRLLSGYKVLGINDAYLLDCCDICFFGDKSWFNFHKDKLREFKKPIFTTSDSNQGGITKLGLVNRGFIKSNTKIGWNCNSGFAGINLALNMGAKNIFLLGFDMQLINGESNWHKNIRNVNPNCYNVYLKNEKEISDNIDKYFSDRNIYNCLVGDIDSRINIFPKIKLNELFQIDNYDIYKKEVNNELL